MNEKALYWVGSPTLKNIFIQDELVLGQEIGPLTEIGRLLARDALKAYDLTNIDSNMIVRTITIQADIHEFDLWFKSLFDTGRFLSTHYIGGSGTYRFAVADGCFESGSMAGPYTTHDGFFVMLLSGYYYGINSIPAANLQRGESLLFRMLPLSDRLTKLQLRCGLSFLLPLYNAICSMILLRWPDATERNVFEGFAVTELDADRKFAQVAPKVFISYSWDGDSHRTWVKSLATRLRGDGVDVQADFWDLVIGDRTPHFMELAVKNNDFILCICTKSYKSKSDNRKGGVGYEGNIMTAELVDMQPDRKFIPVLRGAGRRESIPTWLGGVYCVDLSAEPYSEEEYKKLIMLLYGMTEQAPPLGKRPF